MKMETIILNKERNVTLTAYLLEVGGEFTYVTKRPAILIIPGGGYEMCSDRESDPVAMPYLKAGYQVFILRYSVGNYREWPNPLNDYEDAMSLIRKNSEEWHVYEDKIAVIGFSAGGHLAGAAATMSKNRPNAAILGYAVVSEDVKNCSVTAPDVIPYVDKHTCPCFLFASRADRVVPVMNTVKMIEALTLAEVSYESHIYAYGIHGFSTNDHSVQSRETVICERAKNWVDDSISWLKDIFGEFSMNGMTKPECKAHVNGDHDEFLSVDCTMNCLMGNAQAAELIESLLPEDITKSFQVTDTKQPNEMSETEIMEKNKNDHYRKMTLGDVLGFANTPRNMINQFDEQLRKIPNVNHEIESNL